MMNTSEKRETKPREGMNATLSKAISSSPEWADGSMQFLKSQQKSIDSFLAATTDSVRLVRASKVSRQVLAHYNMAELEDLRAEIQASELLRVIPYSQQTDHSAHTLYLYLLGLHLFFESQALRKEIAKFLKEKDETPELVEHFLYLWV